MFELPDNTMNNEPNMETVSLILEALYNDEVFTFYNDGDYYVYGICKNSTTGYVYFLGCVNKSTQSVSYSIISQLDWDKACSIMKEKGWHLLKKEYEDYNHTSNIDYRMVKDINVNEQWEVVF